MKKDKIINVVCPWEDNPAKPENFYNMKENVNLKEKKSVKSINIKQKSKQNLITEKNNSKNISKKDPYSDIFDELT